MSGERDRGRALVIVPYFGTFGPWFPLYLHSLGRQHTLDLLLVAEGPCPELPPNARHVQMQIADVRALASSRLGMPVALSNTRKLCDLKPVWGLVFEQFVRPYAFWAYGDEDVFYGDLDVLLAPLLTGTHDLVTGSRTMTLGHLTLIRNSARTNTLALGDPRFADVLASEEYWAYDESGWARGEGAPSFTARAQEAQARGDLRVQWGFSKRGDVPWPGRSYVCDARGIVDNDGTAITYYHWGRYRWCGYPFPAPEAARDGFAFDRYGFFDPSLSAPRRTLRRVGGRAREAARTLRQRFRR